MKRVCPLRHTHSVCIFKTMKDGTLVQCRSGTNKGERRNEYANGGARPCSRFDVFFKELRRLSPRSPCSERPRPRVRASGRRELASVGRQRRSTEKRKKSPSFLPPSLPSPRSSSAPALLTYFLRFPHVVAVSAVRRRAAVSGITTTTEGLFLPSFHSPGFPHLDHVIRCHAHIAGSRVAVNAKVLVQVGQRFGKWGQDDEWSCNCWAQSLVLFSESAMPCPLSTRRKTARPVQCSGPLCAA